MKYLSTLILGAVIGISSVVGCSSSTDNGLPKDVPTLQKQLRQAHIDIAVWRAQAEACKSKAAKK